MYTDSIPVNVHGIGGSVLCAPRFQIPIFRGMESEENQQKLEMPEAEYRRANSHYWLPGFNEDDYDETVYYWRFRIYRM